MQDATRSVAATAVENPRFTETPKLSIALHLDKESVREVTREAVTEDDLIDARAELWFESTLRRGQPDVPMDAVKPNLLAVHATSRDYCSGYVLETRAHDGHIVRREFTLRSLHHVAVRASRRLLAAGQLKPADLYYYELLVGDDRAVAVPETAPSFNVVSKSTSLEYLELPLSTLMRDAKPVGPVDDGAYPVFYTEEAHEKAERFARKGADAPEPVETGAVLVGSLCHCPESGEMFAVVNEVLEAADAQQTQYSLYYSDRTWTRIQTIVHAIQRQPGTRTQRIVGQAHGHNFLPANGAPPCEACASLAVCSRTSVFVSDDDLNWSRAVFRRQPWALCHIFGRNARKENVEGLFGQRDARLLERGYYRIPQFDPHDWVGTPPNQEEVP